MWWDGVQVLVRPARLVLVEHLAPLISGVFVPSRVAVCEHRLWLLDFQVRSLELVGLHCGSVRGRKMGTVPRSDGPGEGAPSLWVSCHVLEHPVSDNEADLISNTVMSYPRVCYLIVLESSCGAVITADYCIRIPQWLRGLSLQVASSVFRWDVSIERLTT